MFIEKCTNRNSITATFFKFIRSVNTIFNFFSLHSYLLFSLPYFLWSLFLFLRRKNDENVISSEAKENDLLLVFYIVCIRCVLKHTRTKIQFHIHVFLSSSHLTDTYIVYIPSFCGIVFTSIWKSNYENVFIQASYPSYGGPYNKQEK